jgi:hypothetical protein
MLGVEVRKTVKFWIYFEGRILDILLKTQQQLNPLETEWEKKKN